MVHTFMIAMVLTGLGAPEQPGASAQPAQPSPQFNTAPQVFFYSSPGRSYLGVDIQDVTTERAEALKLKEERGVEVTMVDQDAPAAKAGVKEHDVILEFNGSAVESEEQLRRMLRETPPGRTITLGISRDGNAMKISVQLADRAKIIADSRPKVVIPKIPRVEIPHIDGPSYSFQFQAYSPSLGLQTENPGRQLAEFFGVKDGVGILVRSVEKGGAAEKAGLKAGDMIIRADNEKLSDRADLSHVLRNHREGGKLSLVIVREKHEQTLVVDVPQRNSRNGWWGTLDPDEMGSGWDDDIEELMQQVSPEIDHVKELTLVQARSALSKAHQHVREIQPKIQDAIRQAQSELRRAQKEFQNTLSNLI